MNVHQELHNIIDQLAQHEAEEMLDYIRWLRADEDLLTDEELEDSRLGEAEIRRGEFITLEDYLRARIHMSHGACDACSSPWVHLRTY